MIRWRAFALVLVGVVGCSKAAPIPQGKQGPPVPVTLPSFQGHTKRIDAAEFSEDHSRLVTLSGFEVRVWDANTGRELSQFTVWKGGVDQVGYVRLSPDGQKVATTHHWHYDPKVHPPVRVWDANTGKLLNELRCHARFLGVPAFAADGKRLLTCGGSQFGEPGLHGVRMWDLETDKEVWSTSGVPWYQVGFIPRTTEVFCEGGSELQRCGVDSGQLVGKRVWMSLSFGPAIVSRDAKRATPDTNGTVKVYDTATGKIVFAMLRKTILDPQHLGIADFDYLGPDQGIWTSPRALALSDDGKTAILHIRRYTQHQEGGGVDPVTKDVGRPHTVTKAIDAHLVLMDIEGRSELKRAPVPQDWGSLQRFFFKGDRPFALVSDQAQTTLKLVNVFP